MSDDKTISIGTDDLYRFLIANCRYAYTRNNHLEPSCSYSVVKEYLPLMLEAHHRLAIITAMQLCEECIYHEILSHFYDGFDDEFNNRKDSIDFVEYLIKFVHDNDDADFKPDYYLPYLENLKKDDAPIYNIYEVEYKSPYDKDYEFHAGLPELKDALNESPLSRNNYLDYLFDNVIQESSGIFNKTRVKDNMFQSVKPEAFLYRFDDLKRSFIVRADAVKYN